MIQLVNINLKIPWDCFLMSFSTMLSFTLASTMVIVFKLLNIVPMQQEGNTDKLSYLDWLLN